MFLAMIFSKSNNKVTRWGTFDEINKLNAFVDYLSTMNHPEDFIISWHNGKEIKEVKMLKYINNRYSFDGIGKVIKQVIR